MSQADSLHRLFRKNFMKNIKKARESELIAHPANQALALPLPEDKQCRSPRCCILETE